MSFVLCRPQTATSAVRIGLMTTMKGSDVPPRSVVIRWGNSDTCDGAEREVNKQAAVALAADKMAALVKLESSGVNVPSLYVEGEAVESGMTVVHRPRFHSEGSDFTVRAGPFTVPLGYYGTKLITPANEYRLWFFGNSTLTAKRMPMRSKGQSEADVCRSSWGYQFRPPFRQMMEIGKKVKAAIGLDFGAIDFLWHTVERKWYVLEVNSAPSLDHSQVRAMALSYFDSQEVYS